MTDSELLELTASEPLTLEEEREMQSRGARACPVIARFLKVEINAFPRKMEGRQR